MRLVKLAVTKTGSSRYRKDLVIFMARRLLEVIGERRNHPLKVNT
jgi:hypothetical protein